MFRPQAFFVVVAIVLGLAAGSARAAVNDIMPGDYFPLPSGTTSLALYGFERVQEGPYRDGRKTFDGEIDSTALGLRAAHAFDWGERSFSAVAVLPWVRADVSPAPLTFALGERTRGYADLRLGLTGWLINDKARAHYLGLSGMVIAPSGDYDRRQALNPGENRWKFVLFGGWQKDITPRFLVELSPEIVWHGDNDDYLGNRRLEQRSSTALTGYLRWRVTPAWHVHLGGQANRGGATRINGVDQRNPVNNERLMAGITWFLPDRQQVLLRLGRDIDSDNGFRTQQEIALRLQQSF